MNRDHVRFLVCPRCNVSLDLLDAKPPDGRSVESGRLRCPRCKSDFPIVRHIPRFVRLQNYAGSFGLEWTKHARTQYDSYSGTNVSEERFFRQTKWPKDLSGQLILEVGSGSGRFTEQAASTRGMVISFDLSYAVEANYASNGQRDNVLIVQADIYNMPFGKGSFDRLFCFGVLQHTPDVGKAFSVLPAYLKRGGHIAVDVYRKQPWFSRAWKPRYRLRPILKGMNPEALYRITSNYVRWMWPICRVLNITRFGRRMSAALLVVDYGREFGLSEGMSKEWAILEMFDMLSAAYEEPQTMDAVEQWLKDGGLKNIEIGGGRHSIEARAVKE